MKIWKIWKYWKIRDYFLFKKITCKIYLKKKLNRMIYNKEFISINLEKKTKFN